MSAINEWFGCYNAMFRYIDRVYGNEELQLYFNYLASNTYSDVTPKFREGGLAAIEERYAKNFRLDGDENSVETRIENGELTMCVKCPAYYYSEHEKSPDRQLGEFFCDCCVKMNTPILKEAGYDLQIDIEKCGDCTWHIKKMNEKQEDKQ